MFQFVGAADELPESLLHERRQRAHHVSLAISLPRAQEMQSRQIRCEGRAATPRQSRGNAMSVKDSNGTLLSAGDSVVVIKDLKVKGSSIPLKRGTVIKNIRLVEDDDENVEGNSDKIKGLVLKACFLKKA
jgi:protein PhnA